MERAKKMVLLPVEQVERLQRLSTPSQVNSTSTENNENHNLQTSQTVGDNLSRLDNEMKKVLDSNHFSTDHDRLKHYIKLLQRYLFFRGEKSKVSNIATINENYKEESDLSDDNKIISTVPTIYKRKTQQLLEYLKNYKERISWDREGTVTIDGEKVYGSNIVDLINLAARHRKTFNPVGGKVFVTFLKSIKIPQEYIGNREINSISYNFPNTPEASKEKHNDSDDTEVYKTLPGEETSFLSSTIIDQSPLNSSFERKSDAKDIKRKWLKMKI